MEKQKTFLVTGANDGIGKETARHFAGMGARVVMICRSQERGETAKKEIIESTGNENVHLYLADLASQNQIREACKAIIQDIDSIDVLVNNAGFMGYPERQLTEDGIESTFAVNHLGPFMITNLLFPLLRNTDNARIVNVSSVAHKLGEFDEDNLQLDQKYKAFQAYSNSKLMNILFTRELGDRIKDTGITTNCLDPGKVYTGIGKTYSKFFQFLFKIASPFLLTPKQGAQTSIYLSLSPEVSSTSGEYFVKKKITSTAKKTWDKEDMKRLWEISTSLTGMEGQTV
ncbi:MAG: SDR family oxidoreductase [Bacteroidota bacterium]